MKIHGLEFEPSLTDLTEKASIGSLSYVELKFIVRLLSGQFKFLLKTIYVNHKVAKHSYKFCYLLLYVSLNNVRKAVLV